MATDRDGSRRKAADGSAKGFLSRDFLATGQTRPASFAFRPRRQPPDSCFPALGGISQQVWTGRRGEVYAWAGRHNLATDRVYAWLFKTTDAGANWEVTLSVPEGFGAFVLGTEPNDIFAGAILCPGTWSGGCGGGRRLQVFHFAGVSWLEQPLPVGDFYPRGIDGRPNDVYMVVLPWGQEGTNGRVLRYDGNSWQVVFTDTTGWPSDFDHLGPIYIRSNEIYVPSCWGHWLYNGTSWSFFQQFDFCDETDGWGMRDAQGNLHMYVTGNNNFSNGVRLWKFTESSPGSMTGSWGSKFGYIFSEGNGFNCGSGTTIWGSGPNDIWATGNFHTDGCGVPRGGRIYHFDGTAWTRVTTPFDPLLLQSTARDVWGTAADDVWVATEDRLLHYGPATPPNQPPAANAGPDQTVECTSHTGASVTLNGSGSSDPDGDALSFEWRTGAGAVVGATAGVNVTLPLGSHTFTLTVNDGKGGTASDSVVVTVQDTTPPVLTLARDSVTVMVPTASATGAVVDVLAASGATATDLCDPNTTITHNAPAEFPIGLTSVTFTATDQSGNFTQRQLTVQVVYTFGGYLPPIRNDGTSIFRSGRTVPVKFQLTAADGSFVTTATATLQVFKVTDAVLGTVEEITPEASGTSNTDNLFRFDASTNQYIYNLNTSGYTAGTYLLRVRLNDQTTHDVHVSLR